MEESYLPSLAIAESYKNVANFPLDPVPSQDRGKPPFLLLLSRGTQNKTIAYQWIRKRCCRDAIITSHVLFPWKHFHGNPARYVRVLATRGLRENA
jgi:hypothetical protein